MRHITLSFALLCISGALEAASIKGPDSFGYTATDGIAFNFTDITATGTRILVASDDDTLTAGLGFSFNFYGSSYSETCISANGLLAFGGCESSHSPVDFSTTLPPNDLPTIAALWDDWQFYNFTNGAQPDAVYYLQTGNPGSQRFIVQWNLAYGFPSSPAPVTFEAVLFEGSGNIQIHYRSLDSGDQRAFGSSAAVGIRDAGGDANGRNLMWQFQSGGLTDQSAIQFGTATVPEPATDLQFLSGCAIIGVIRKLRKRV
jgi:hypothetical protein